MNRKTRTAAVALAVMAAISAPPVMAATPAPTVTARPWLVSVAGIPQGPGNTPRVGGQLTLTNTGKNPAPVTVTVWKISQPFDWDTPREAMKAQERHARVTVAVAGSPVPVAVNAPPCGPWQWDTKVERSPGDFVWIAGGTSRGRPCAVPTPTPTPTAKPTPAPVPSGTKAPLVKPAAPTSAVAPASVTVPAPASVAVPRMLPAVPVVAARPTLADTGPWNAGVMALIGGLLLLAGLALIGVGNRAGHRDRRR